MELNDVQAEQFAQELDAIRAEVMASRGAGDRRYILRLIRTQRGLDLGGRIVMLLSILFLPAWGHGLAHSALFWTLLATGTLSLALAKILENMEIGHNVMHAQWDWMCDPQIQSATWEWDHACPADQWVHSHNVEHHTWTNVLGKDRDIGYGMLRVTERQRWRPFYLLQPFSAMMMALFFEAFIALHDLEINRVLAGKKSLTQLKPKLDGVRRKVWRQTLKDFILWPLAAVVLAAPFAIAGFGPTLLEVALYVAGANLAANLLRNLWTFGIIFCGHFPAGVQHFSKDSVKGESRGRWYVRQLLGSCNIGGGRLFHVLSGNLSHQIEHHLFPDMPSNRYPQIAPRVRALAARFGLPYNSGSFTRQFGTTIGKLVRLSLPSPQPSFSATRTTS